MVNKPVSAITRKELQELAALRLREAEALFERGLYDGCVYLCGYVIELALKAMVCKTLKWMNIPIAYCRQPFGAINLTTFGCWLV